MGKFYYINTKDYQGIVNDSLYSKLKDNNLLLKFEEETTFDNALSKYLKTLKPSSNAKTYNNSNSLNSSSNSNSVIKVWTDGGSRITGNAKGSHVNATDEAAWAYKIQIDDNVYEDSSAELGATNNKMELMALNKALLKLLELKKNNNTINVYSDSMYVINTVTKWMKGWKATGWKRKGKYPIKNIDLIQNIDDCLQDFSDFNMQWVKGHTELSDEGHAGNNQVDSLLNKSMDNHARLATAKQIKYIKHLDPNANLTDDMTSKEASMLIKELLNDK